jgi:hypothetical protein
MSQIGEIKYGGEIGKKPFNALFIWVACETCGRERWVHLVRGKAAYSRCAVCRNHLFVDRLAGKRGDEHPHWKGGRFRSKDGYIRIGLQPNDPLYPMANKKGYVLEHRLLVARRENRCLEFWEVVHHINGIRDDNRLGNLKLLPSREAHLPSIQWQRALHRQDKHIAELEKRITLLEAENIILRGSNALSPKG